MIPDVPAVIRRKLGSGTTPSYYDPHTRLYRRIVQPLDGDLLAVVTPGCTIVHENVHWLQYHGTTIGALLGHLRYVQKRTAQAFFESCPQSRRRNHLQRRLEKGIPLIAIDPQGQFDHVEGESQYGQTDSIWAQIWHDCMLVHALLFDLRDIGTIRWDFQTAFREVMADAMLYASEHGVGTYPGNEQAREMYRIDQVQTVQSADGFVLTTVGIMETAATLQELFCVGSKSVIFRGEGHLEGLSRILQKILEKIQKTEYGYAAAWFFGITGLQPADALSTLSVICDLSLNPAVPPICSPPEGPVNWADIYPPARFVNLAAQVRKVGVLPFFADARTILSYSIDLCHSADLPHPLEYVIQQPAASLESYFMNGLPDEGWDVRKGHISYSAFSLWCALEMWKVRKHAWPVFSNLAECHIGDGVAAFFDILMSEGPFWFMSPLLLWQDDSFLVGPRFKAGATCLLYSAAMEYLMYDVVIGSGPVTFSDYPMEIHPKLAKMRDLLSSLLLN
jgi:hypothetical protein